MGFGVACVSLIVSYLIYVGFRKTFKHADVTAKQQAAATASGVKTVELTPAQTKSRITALMLVFAVVIFFWMAFHQNGSTMTFLRPRLHDLRATGIARMGFDIFTWCWCSSGSTASWGFFQSEKSRGTHQRCGAQFAVAVGVLDLPLYA